MTAHPPGKVPRPAVDACPPACSGAGGPEVIDERHCTSGHPNGGDHCLFIYSPISLWEEDLSDVKKALDALKESGVKVPEFAAYFQEHPEEARRCTEQARILSVNDATLRLFGAGSKDELLANLDTILGEPRPLLGGLIPNLLCIADDETHCGGELTARTLFGETLHLRCLWSIARPHDYSRVCFSLIDITLQRKAEMALRHSEERFRSVIQSSPMGIHTYVMDDDERLILTGANPAADKILGLDHRPLIGKPIEEAFVGLDETGIPERYRQVCRTGVPWHLEEQPYDSGPVCGVFEAHAFPTAPGAMATMFIDITARKQAEREHHDLEDRLHHAQKMEAIGELAGGIAHDFNNLLMAVQGNAELLAMSAQSGSEEEELTSQIVSATRRAANLTRQLLAFARKGQRRVIPVDLHVVLTEVIQLLQHGVDPRVSIVPDLQADGATIMGDPSLLQTAFMNLGLNARDAMPEGGEITFATRNVEDGPAATDPGAGLIEVRVSDTGAGIPREIQHRIYEPFFTTKALGHGTGLGLAGVYGAVQTHGGTISVDSEPGRGASFRIVFPLTDADASMITLVDTGAITEGKGRLLVVDDEEAVLAFTKRTLEKLGYTVTACDDGAAAVHHYAEHHAGIDLVILDLVMPGLNGEDTARELKRINPEVRILIASAYSSDASSHRLLRDQACGFLRKPYSVDALSREVYRHVENPDP